MPTLTINDTNAYAGVLQIDFMWRPSRNWKIGHIEEVTLSAWSLVEVGHLQTDQELEAMGRQK